jgi:hypothetical protein
MRNFVSNVFLGLLAGLFLSCSSAPTATNPYRPLSDVSNAEVVGTIQTTFDSEYWTSPAGQFHSQLNGTAYVALLEAAKKEYSGNIDVADITWVQIRYSKDKKMYEFSANGKVIMFGGGNRRNAAAGVEGALERAAGDTLKNVPTRSKIAIVYITAEDRSSTDYISGELEFIWVNAGYTIIDRSQLGRIRREQNFQMSGEVDDATAVSIGKFSGADIIVTGRVDGEGNLRRLRLRALNTQTAQVVGVASERL